MFYAKSNKINGFEWAKVVQVQVRISFSIVEKIFYIFQSFSCTKAVPRWTIKRGSGTEKDCQPTFGFTSIAAEGRKL